MLLFFMSVPVAGVIVPNVTAISASMRPKLEMNIHFVIFKFPLFIESFSTKVTDKPLVLLRRMNTSDMILHAEYHDAAEIALLRLHAIPQVIPQAHLVPIFFSTFVAATLFSIVIFLHVIIQIIYTALLSTFLTNNTLDIFRCLPLLF